MRLISLSELRRCPVANTDVGDLIAVNGLPQNEFLVKGTIKKVRAGLFFIDIEGETFTTSKLSNFEKKEKVICVLRAEVNSDNVDINNNNAKFIVKGLEKL